MTGKNQTESSIYQPFSASAHSQAGFAGDGKVEHLSAMNLDRVGT